MAPGVIQDALANGLPKLKLASIVAGQFTAIRLLGRGGYGMVYEVIRINEPQLHYACKVEAKNEHNNLKLEIEIMKLLKEKESIHSVHVLTHGTEKNYNYVIMSLVGPNLSELRRRLNSRTFTIYTTCVVALQCFDAIKEIHDIGYVHRDVKPSNFAIGCFGGPRENVIHILDFEGFETDHRFKQENKKDKELRKPRRNTPFRGTIEYCSLNVHLCQESGRHDDMWSLLYMITEMLIGDLPWHNMDKVQVKLKKGDLQEELFERSPQEFRNIKNHLEGLTYAKCPDYEFIRSQLVRIFVANKLDPMMPLDWEPTGHYHDKFSASRRILKDQPKGVSTISMKDLLSIPEAVPERSMGKIDDNEHVSSVSKTDDTIQMLVVPTRSKPKLPQVKGPTRNSQKARKSHTPGKNRKSKKKKPK